MPAHHHNTDRFHQTPYSINRSDFLGTYGADLVQVPCGSLRLARNASTWGKHVYGLVNCNRKRALYRHHSTGNTFTVWNR